jgi:hypothetical protein
VETRAGFLFMSYSTEIAADLQEIESDLGTTCTIGADTGIACAANFSRAGQVIDLGGKEATIKITLIVRASLLTTEPTVGNKYATYLGTKRRIVAVRYAPTQTHYELDLADLSEK